MMRTPAQLQNVTGDVLRVVTGHDYTNFSIDASVYSGVKFDADGSMYAYNAGGSLANIGTWLVSGTNSTYYLVTTIDSGALTTDAGRGPLQLNTTRTYNCIDSVVNGAAVEAVVTFTIEDVGTADHAGPTPLSFSAFKDSLS